MYRISQGSRTLTRLVMECRRKKPAITLDQLITAANFDVVVAATKNLAFGEAKAYTLGRLIGNLLGQ